MRWIIQSHNLYLQHPVCDELPHVRLDLLLDILEVVVVGDVAILRVHHVAEHAVLQQSRINLGLEQEKEHKNIDQIVSRSRDLS